MLEAFDAALELVEDEGQQERLRRVIQASQASVERATQDLLAGVLEEVNSELAGRARVDLRYTAAGISVSVVSNAAAAEGDEDEAWLFSDSELEKVTLRLPVELKDRASSAAKETGLSANAWFTRLLARELREPRDDSEEREPSRKKRKGRRGHLGGHNRREQGRHGDSLKGWIGQ
ncbi:MAG TPA: hypothetical protein QGF05_06805 [Dehalococcoidia bacterium]|nr:hypothetical protein [Dehalococcoidia bacterium]